MYYDNWKQTENVNELSVGDRIAYMTNNHEMKHGGEIEEIPDHKKSLKIYNKKYNTSYFVSVKTIKYFLVQ